MDLHCVVTATISDAFLRDLSEQIKAATKENHVRAEKTQLMLNYQKGQITLPQYKVRLITPTDKIMRTERKTLLPSGLHPTVFCFRQVLLCSLYEIYKVLEQQMDKNRDHPAVAPIYFPQELARLESLRSDLEHFLGADWRKKVIVPAATHQYVERLRLVSGGEEGVGLMVSEGFALCI